jgi:predicted transcriptional regulator
MTTQEQRAMQMLGTTEEGFRKIQEAHKLFRGLWDDDSFIELWKSIPDEACEALFNAVERLEKAEARRKERDIIIDKLHMQQRDLCDKLIGIYAEDESEDVKEAVIGVLGENEFYATLVEGGYDLNADDREAIADLLR